MSTVAVFDLDGTLTWHDTLVQFLSRFVRRHPSRLAALWRLPAALAGYVLRHRDRGLLKSQVIRMLLGGAHRREIDACAESFVADLLPGGRLRPAALAQLEAHRAAGDRLVLLSASPDLYVPRIGRLLRFDRTVCTEIDWAGDTLLGTLKTANRRGAEKTRCLEELRREYPGLPIVAYGNSASDLDHLRRADRALLVNGNASARAAAARHAVPTADWN
jgi:phosphatidylglycerophosphatase C